MKDYFLAILKAKTFKHSGITFFGILINGIIGIIFYILAARSLGPSAFGVFSVAVTVLTLVADIGSLGTDTGIVRFVGKYFDKDRQKALRFLKLTLEIKILVWIGVLIIGWLVVPWIARTVLIKPELIFPLRLAMIGVGSVLLFSFTTNTLQGLQKYWAWSGINVVSNSIRLAGILILIYFGLLNTQSIIVNYIAAPFVGFFLGFTLLPNFWSVKNESEIARELFRYNKWVALFILIAAISSRLDMFLTTRLLSLREVGIYSVAVSLASIVPQFVYALGAVVAPKLAKMENREKTVIYLKKLQLFVTFLAVMGLALGILLAYFVIPFFYGAEYLQSITPFIILLVSQAIFLISIPAHSSIFYYFSYPKLFIWVGLIHLFIMGVIGYILIVKFGFLGAASTVLLGNIFNFLIPAIWVIRKLKELTR